MEWNGEIPACPDGFDTGDSSSPSLSAHMFPDTAAVLLEGEISSCSELTDLAMHWQ